MRYLFLVTMLMSLAFAGIFAGSVESHDDVTWNHTHFWLSEAAYDDLDHDSIRWTGGHNHGDGVKHGHPNDPEHGGHGTASKAHLMGSHGAVLKNASPPADPAPVKPVKNNPTPAPGGGGGGIPEDSDDSDNDSDDSDDGSDDDSEPASTVEITPRATAPVEPTPAPVVPQTNILRITRFWTSHGEIYLTLTALANETEQRNLTVIINSHAFVIPKRFLGTRPLNEDDTRTLYFVPVKNRLLLIGHNTFIENGKTFFRRDKRFVGANNGWDTLDQFNPASFSIILRDTGSTRNRDTTTHRSFNRAGHRLEAAASAPSLRRPKLTTLWARLKQRR